SKVYVPEIHTAILFIYFNKFANNPNSSWALWFYKNDKSKTWQANLQLITKFDTVEDFWALYNHIQVASKLSSGCDYSLFKDGIEPMWEDRRNKCGGRWLITLSKQQRHTELDKFWLETVRYIKLCTTVYSSFAPNAASMGSNLYNPGLSDMDTRTYEYNGRQWV
uniref:Eukaryotic translation initiation factor 4E family member 1B n=1 Tax=Erpetoichthys calabaricus TaxID=27687 RepID=A0A8C4TDQ3_ERPCA